MCTGECSGKSLSNSETAAGNGERGRIDRAMSARYLSNNDLKDSVFYICGPPVMIKAMQNLIKNESQKERIKIEEFTGY